MPKLNLHFPRGLKIMTTLRAEPCCLCGLPCSTQQRCSAWLAGSTWRSGAWHFCWGKPGAEEPWGAPHSSPRCKLSQFCSFIRMILQLKIVFFLMPCSVPASANEVLWNCPDLSSKAVLFPSINIRRDILTWEQAAVHCRRCSRKSLCVLCRECGQLMWFFCVLWKCLVSVGSCLGFPHCRYSSKQFLDGSCLVFSTEETRSIQQQEPLLSVRRSNGVLLTFLQSCQQN